MDLNQGPTGYASHYHFHDLFRVCELDYTFTPRHRHGGGLPSSLYTFPVKLFHQKRCWAWLGITMIKGFPEFDRYFFVNYFTKRPERIYFTVMKKFIKCKICHVPLKGKQRIFCSRKCMNRFHQCYPSQKKRGLERKIMLFKMKGGQCSMCGYKKNISSLSFHHLNAKQKDFSLDVRSLSNRTLEVVMKELKKCILICHNCHHEIHNPEYDTAILSSSRLL